MREKLEYPHLKQRIKSHYKHYSDTNSCPVLIVVESHSSRIQISQELKKEDVLIRQYIPSGDKESRLILQSSKIENGTILFPEQAPWLPDYENELLRQQ